MILEVARLDVRPELKYEFESAFSEAQMIIIAMEGYISHQLQQCLEQSNRYILLINWEKHENHTEGFRGSSEYEKWRELLHHFYDPFPDVEHYSLVFENSK